DLETPPNEAKIQGSTVPTPIALLPQEISANTSSNGEPDGVQDDHNLAPINTPNSSHISINLDDAEPYQLVGRQLANSAPVTPHARQSVIRPSDARSPILSDADPQERQRYFDEN